MKSFEYESLVGAGFIDDYLDTLTEEEIKRLYEKELAGETEEDTEESK